MKLRELSTAVYMWRGSIHSCSPPTIHSQLYSLPVFFPSKYSPPQAKVEKHLAEIAAEGGRDLANHYAKTTAAEAKTTSA